MNGAPRLGEQEKIFDSALLMAGFDACTDGLAVVESGRVIYANRAFQKNGTSGDGSGQSGRPLSDLLPADTRYLSSTEAPIGLSAGPTEIEASVNDFEQNQRSFQVICARQVPKRSSSGVVPGEFRKMEAIGRLAAGIAHDLNNTLTAIMLYSGLLVATLEAGADSHRHAEAIHQAGANGVSLVQQLMSPSGEEVLAVQPLSWNRIVSEMTSLLIRLAATNIEIETRLSESLGFISMDSGRAQRIILNLFTNARDATASGGKITLSTCNSTFRRPRLESKTTDIVPCVEFGVTDTGTGMDKKTLERVFRPFFTTKPRNQGNGLGLSTVRGIVKQARGEIEIKSELGKGTRVTVRIPQIEVP
ncbi:MAG: two-component system sensor histidine kinase NtrB [Terriglobales bacterium]